MNEALAVLQLPLQGRRLIEASAGTGKTYTLVNLYLRLLLGHGGKAGFTNHQGKIMPLGVEQILVVTFTEAATAELRLRIQQRIALARRLLEKGLQQACTDDVLFQCCHGELDRLYLLELLQVAERELDQAAIYTIHGFCQRMLSQYAFETGAQYDCQLQPDTGVLQHQAIVDYWRQVFYGQPSLIAGELARIKLHSPADLLTALKPLLSRQKLQLEGVEQGVDFTAAVLAAGQTVSQYKQQWLQGSAEFEATLSACRHQFHGVKFPMRWLPQWLAEVNQWAVDKVADLAMPKCLYRFSARQLETCLKQGYHLPKLPLAEAIDHWTLQFNYLPELLAVASQTLPQYLQKLKQARQVLGFDDLLTQLDTALQGDSGLRLAQGIRQQLPLAMVDEFQDTDPLQLQIFNTIYNGQIGTALVLIGDPKQAIYSFRGADLNTYIAAQKQADSCYTLATNWRSCAAMVTAVNQLFTARDNSFLHPDITFSKVNDSGLADQLWLGNQCLDGLHLWSEQAVAQDSAMLTADRYQQLMAATCADQIIQLLGQPDDAETTTCKLSGQPLQPGDMAVLVSNRQQAQLLHDQLAERGLGAVYLSDRQLVFAASTAEYLWYVLRASLVPRRADWVRAALATPLLGLDCTALLRLQQDESEWRQRIEHFFAYGQLWQRQGIGVLLRQLLYDYRIPERWLAQKGGERQLTDLRHLAELLQQASYGLDSPWTLLHWFEQRMLLACEQSGETREQIQRLESETNLVQIVTIHKAKGLQYPLVFVPFASLPNLPRETFFHRGNQLVLHLRPDAEDLQQAHQEALAEQLRLLYVALTRAKFATWVGLLPVAKGKTCRLPDTALGYLLQQRSIKASKDMAWPAAIRLQLETRLATLVHQADGCIIRQSVPEPMSQPCRLQYARTVQPARQSRVFGGNIASSWQVSSYSALVRQPHMQQSHDNNLPLLAKSKAESELTLPWVMPVLSERVTKPAASEAAITSGQRYACQFNRGPQHGQFLHQLLEQLDFAHLYHAEQQHWLSLQLQAGGYGVEDIAGLTAWLDDILQHDLTAGRLAGGLRLCDLPKRQRLTEMEFNLAVSGPGKIQLAASRLQQIAEQNWPQAVDSRLDFKSFEGLLKGYIDLVFCHNGCYYLADYKSNYLGPQSHDYHEQAIDQAMLAHRYDLQCLIYSLALHCYLQQRLPDYQWEHHFGGFYCLFLRGMDPAQPGSGVWFNRPDKQVLDALQQLFMGSDS